MVSDTDIALLGATPWFDAATAHDVLSLVQKRQDESETRDVLSALGRGGLLQSAEGAWSVREPLRSDLRQALASRDQDLYSAVLETFWTHAENGLGSRLRRIMGAQGAELNILAVGAARGDGTESFDELVAAIEDSAVERSSRYAHIAARLVETYAGVSDRRSEFLRGLALWRDGRPMAAEQAFAAVRADYRLDRAGTTASHLLGLIAYRRGEYEPAVSLLEEAVADSRMLENAAGLAVCLTSLGRVLKDKYRDQQSYEDLARARACLEEAREIYGEENPRGVSTLIALAQVEQASGDDVASVTLAEKAFSSAATGPDKIAAAVALGAIYRGVDRDQDAVHIAREAERVAEAVRHFDLSFAKLLNVTAAAERKLGDLPEAIRHASRSVEIGRQLGEQRHVAHALHTLAAVEMEGLGAQTRSLDPKVKAIRSLLAESRGILASLKNWRGVQMVDNTITRLERTVVPDEDVEGTGAEP